MLVGIHPLIEDFFQIEMTEMVFVKTECDPVNVKEEYIEEEDPLMIKGAFFLAGSLREDEPKKNVFLVVEPPRGEGFFLLFK